MNDPDKQEAHNPHKDSPDDHLVGILATDGPHAELLRRNTEALKEASSSSHKQTRVILFLTVILAILGISEFTLEIVPGPGGPWVRFVMAMIVVGLVGYKVIKEVKADDN